MDKTVYIANGAGFSGDRFDAAVPLVAQLASCSGPRYLMFEVLAERTIAIAQIAKEKDPASGYSPYLEKTACTKAARKSAARKSSRKTFPHIRKGATLGACTTSLAGVGARG